MKSPPIPGWLIVDESGIPVLWFRTRDEARDVARDAGIPSKQVQREECGVEA